MFYKQKWLLTEPDETAVQTLADALGISRLCATLLLRRGFASPERAKAFLEKSDAFLYNPFLMKDMKEAVARIRLALERQEKISIYGDYDVDGVTSVSILYMYLKEHGAEVSYYIPTRESEGYGLNTGAFEGIAAGGTKLVITVDTGITALEEIEYAKSLGLDVIVTDHHECRAELPSCSAVVNPRRPDCPYPFKELSGVGVVFKFLCAIELELVNGGEYNLFTIKDMCRRYIDLVTVGTIADVMPLCDENRMIVYLGLQLLAATHNIGLRALFRAIGTDVSKKITASAIGYTVAPRINAAGRIGSAERAVQLFLAKSPQAADLIAEELCATNRERQLMENAIYEEAVLQAERESDRRVLVLSGNAWHPGVIGIVASRITERYGKASILLSFSAAGSLADGSDLGKGSARSVPGLNIVKALTACDDLLIKYGGHELAAGLSLTREHLEAFKDRICEYAETHTESAEDAERLPIDALLSIADAKMELIDELSMLEPHGAQNPEPLFLIREARIEEVTPLSAGRHTKLVVSQGDTKLQAICFGYNLAKEGFAYRDTVDLVGNLSRNEFRGNVSLQFILRDIDYSDSFYAGIAQTEREFAEISAGERRCEPEEIPARDDFVAVYRVLQSEELIGRPVSLLKLSSMLPKMSYLKLRIIAEAFSECGILAQKEDESRLTYTQPEVTSKKDLFATPIMKILSTETE